MGPNDPREITLRNGETFDGQSIGQRYITINSGGTITTDGDFCNTVIFTSTNDDTKGGDTNLDGNATSPLIGDHSGININGSANMNINFTEFYYSNYTNGAGAINIESGSPNISISNSLFKNNEIGIDVTGTANPATMSLSNNNFIDNNLYAIHNDSTAYTVNAANNWWNHITGPYSYKNRTGVLSLYCKGDANCDWRNGAYENGPLVYRWEPGATYDVETQILEFDIKEDTEAGLTLLLNRNNAYLFGRYFDSASNNGIRLTRIYNDSSFITLATDNTIQDLPLGLKVVVAGNNADFQYSTNMSDWYSLTTVNFTDPNNFNPWFAGLYAKEWGNNNDRIDPPFSYFEFSTGYRDDFDDGNMGLFSGWTQSPGTGEIYETPAGADWVSFGGDEIYGNINFDPWNMNPTSLCGPTAVGQIRIETTVGILPIPFYNPTDPGLTSSGALRIYDGIGIRCFDLLDIGHDDASPVRIQTDGGIKALRKQ